MKKLAALVGAGLLPLTSINTAEAQHRSRDRSSDSSQNLFPANASAAPGTTLSPEQIATIKRILDATHAKATAPVSGTNAPFAVGSTLPEGIPLKSLPPGTGLATYRFGIVNGRTVIVHPNNRKVVGIVP